MRSDELGVAVLRRLVCSAVANQKFVLISSRSDLAIPTVHWLRELGAAAPFLITASDGPVIDGVGQYRLPTPDGSPEPQAHQLAWWSWVRQRLTRSDTALCQALADYDPSFDALIYDAALDRDASVLGRKRYGWRRPAWAAYEDKTFIDAFWDRCGIRRLPSSVVALDSDEDVAAAVRRHDRGSGVVLSGDTSSVVHGGAIGVRAVRTHQQLIKATKYLRTICETVRIAPFAEGTPCTVHGIVSASHTSVFPPLELIVLRGSSGKFIFAGTNSAWQPRLAETGREIRAVASTAGDKLREEVGYAGGFTIDGIVTPDGFVPTELNARLGTGLGDGVPVRSLPLRLFANTVQERPTIRFSSSNLEKIVSHGFLDHPTMDCVMYVPQAQITADIRLEEDYTGMRPCQEDAAQAALKARPAQGGSFVAMRIDPEAGLGHDQSTSSRFASALLNCSELLGVDFTGIEGARDVEHAR